MQSLLFSADYIEPNRKIIPGLDKIRNVIFEDLDMAIYLILDDTMHYLEKENRPVDDTSREAYLYYKN